MELVGRNGADSADSGQFSTTSLHIAVSDGSVLEIEKALNEGIDVKFRDENGTTPLHLAAAQNSDPAVVECCSTGALTSTSWTGIAPRRCILAAAQNSDPAVVECCSTGALTSTSWTGIAGRRCIWPQLRTPIQQWWSYCSTGALTLEPRIRVAIRRCIWRRPRIPNQQWWSCCLTEERISKLDVVEGDTPLHAAADGDFLEIVTQLVERGANVHAKNDLGTTVLHVAASRAGATLVKLLLDQGADMEAVDQYGDTPVLIAGASKPFGGRRAIP